MHFGRSILTLIASAFAIVACDADATEPAFVNAESFAAVVLPGPTSPTPLLVPLGGTRQLMPAAGLARRTVLRTGWRSENPAIASVGLDGVVRGESEGYAWIVAEAGDAVDSALVGVFEVGTFALSPQSILLGVGDSVQVRASTISPVSWTVANADIARISAGGWVKGITAGTTRLDGISEVHGAGTTSITVTGLNEEEGSVAADTSGVELPRVYLDGMLAEARGSSTGRQIRVSNQAQLQRAVDTAKFGDVILLQPGATYTGTTVLRAKPAGSGWITIKTETSLPAAGQRIRPSDATRLAKLIASSPVNGVITTESGAHHYLLQGVEVTAADNATFAYVLVMVGATAATQGTIQSQPHHIVLDRVYVHGTPILNFQRCVLLNAAYAAVVDSWLSECHSNSFDSQAILSFNASGPLKIENNYLEAAGENLMLGGADAASSALIPSDVEIRRNHFFKPLSWRSASWIVKNHLEMKVGRRVLVEGNILENSWGAQLGTSVLLISTNQDGKAPFSETADITVRYNIIRNVGRGFLVAGKNANPAIPTHRVRFSNNEFANVGAYNDGRLWYVGGADSVFLENNAGAGVYSGLMLEGAPVNFLKVKDNVIGSSGTWAAALISASGKGIGTSALDGHALNWVFTGNLLVGVDRTGFPPGNILSGLPSTIGFVDYPNSLQLRTNAPFVAQILASRGVLPGPNYTTLAAKTRGVLVLP